MIIPLLVSSLVSIAGVGALDNRLLVTLGPPNLIADGADHDCVFVQLTNAKGEPIQAVESVTITLTSSRLEVGTVEGTVTIPAGSIFGRATFHATRDPGVTLITATAPGYMAGGAELTTISHSTNSKLVVFPLPSVVPAINGTEGKVAIEILDEFDAPYFSAENVSITLATSSSLISTPSEAVILAGSYYTIVDFKVNGNFTIVNNSTVTPIGNVTLSALAQGFWPDTTSIQVKTPGNETLGRYLSLEIGPNILMPGDTLSEAAIVSLQDVNGDPIILNGTAIHVALSSSSDRTVAQTEKTITIANNTFYSFVEIDTIGRGTSLIAATAQGMNLETETITVEGSVPTSLQIWVTPSDIISGDPLRPTVTVEAVDQNGAPVIVDDDVNVFLSSSNTAIASPDQFIVIPKGHYYAQVPVNLASEVGSIDIAASARGFEPATNSLQTIELTMNATLTASRPTQVGDKILLSVTVDRLGEPVNGVEVEWSAIGGVVEASNSTTDENGFASATITQLSATMRIGVHLSKPGYSAIDLTRLSTVPTPQSTELTVNIFGLIIPLFYIIVGVGILVISIFALYIFLKYRRRNSDKLEVVG